MADLSIPSFLIPQDGATINITISGSDALLEDQGVTYNQSGMTYNQAGIMYGGVYNVDEDIIPSFSLSGDNSPLHLNITGTDALLADQGYTYNQVGFTYNQAGVMYGGVYNSDEVIIPMVLSAQLRERISLDFSEIPSPVPQTNQTGQSIGPGFFMWITQ